MALKNNDSNYIKWYADSKMQDRGFGNKIKVDSNVQLDVFKEIDNQIEKLKAVVKTPEQLNKLKEMNNGVD